MNVCINNPLSKRTLHTKLVVLDLVIEAMFCFFGGGWEKSSVFFGLMGKAGTASVHTTDGELGSLSYWKYVR